MDSTVANHRVSSAWQPVWLPQPDDSQRADTDTHVSVNRRRTVPPTHGYHGHPRSLCYSWLNVHLAGGTAASAPPPFRPGNPALCGSHPLVTPYYCRLGDLLCLYVYPLFVYYFVCVCICVFCVFFVLSGLFSFVAFFLQYFDTVGWIFLPIKTVSHMTYTVLAGT